MRLVEVKCKSCGGEMTVNTDKNVVFCSYCGAQQIIDDEVQEQKITNGYEFGYEQEMGRLHAQQDFERESYRASDEEFYQRERSNHRNRSSRQSGDAYDAAWYSMEDTDNSSPKSRLIALILCFFFGGFGVHRFYIGKIGSGIFYLLTFGIFGIGWVVDILLILFGKMKDSRGKYIEYWDL